MKKKGLSGSVTIEAAFALVFFILGYMCILSLVCTVRAECAVQCGIRYNGQVPTKLSVWPKYNEYCADKKYQDIAMLQTGWVFQSILKSPAQL